MYIVPHAHIQQREKERERERDTTHANKHRRDDYSRGTYYMILLYFISGGAMAAMQYTDEKETISRVPGSII